MGERGCHRVRESVCIVGGRLLVDYVNMCVVGYVVGCINRVCVCVTSHPSHIVLKPASGCLE